jgi:MFS family permease
MMVVEVREIDVDSVDLEVAINAPPSLLLRQQRGFPLLFAGATLSRLATEMYSVSVVLFVLSVTHSARLAGLTVAAATFPTVITGPVVGAWLDRSRHRRTAFLLSPVVLAATMGGFLTAAHRVSGWVLILLAFVAGLPSPIRTGGFSGLIPTVVPEPVLPRAYGIEAASYNIAGIAGPAAAGAIAGIASPGWAIAATAVTALLATIVIARVPIEPGERGEGKPLRALLREGTTLLWRVQELRSITVATTLSMGFFGMVVLGFPLFAHELGHRRAAGGLLFSVLAIGSLAGSILWTKVAGRFAEEPAAFVTMALFGVALGLVGLTPDMPLALVAVALAGFFEGPLLAVTLNLRQRCAPVHLRTQVFTTAASLKIGAFAIGSAVAGAVAAGLGARGMLVLAGSGQLLSLVVGLASRRRSVAAS